MAGTILVVSPHLDDAVLSIGATLAARAAAGDRIVIASVYTTGPPLDEIAAEMRQFADYTTRCAEDDAACAVIGAEVRRLAQIERAFRPPYLTGWSFFSTPSDRSGFTGLPGVRDALESLVDLVPDEIFVPLGIGNHIDHVEALVAATDWASARGWLDRLRFYEDFYALAGAMRRVHFVARQRLWPRWHSPLLRARRLAVILRAIAAARRGPPVETFLVTPLRTAGWTVTPTPVAATEERKLAAIACYASQTRAFGGMAGIARATRAYHRWWGDAEPLWRATPAG
jgi:LmbE family N-acetylglucosaminyl deacetylase